MPILVATMTLGITTASCHNHQWQLLQILFAVAHVPGAIPHHVQARFSLVAGTCRGSKPLFLKLPWALQVGWETLCGGITGERKNYCSEKGAFLK